jgi:hypothetical protein
MTSLPHYLVADSLRTITIALWGVLLAQSFWTLWYAAKIRGIYHQMRRRGLTFISVWWPMLLLTIFIDSMATEISWKIVFDGVGKVGIALWTYPNVPIYLVGNVLLYLIRQLERERYRRASIQLGKIKLKEREPGYKDPAG